MKVWQHPPFLHNSCTSHGPPAHTWVIWRPACHNTNNLLRKPGAPVNCHSTLSWLFGPWQTLFRPQGRKGNAVHPLLCPQHKTWLHPNACGVYGCWRCRCGLLWSAGRLWTMQEKPLLGDLPGGPVAKTPNIGGPSPIPGQGTRYPHATTKSSQATAKIPGATMKAEDSVCHS